MKEIYNLIRVQLQNSLGINALIHTKDKKERRKGILIGIALLYALVVMWPMTVFYFYTMMKVYVSLGVPEAILAVAMVMCSLLCLLTTIYKGSPTLFGFTDYDIIMPMPIKTSNIVLSKLIMLYLTNIGFILFMMIPAAGVYVYFVSPGFLFYPTIILLTLTLPLFPIIIATAFSVIIHMVSSRFRAKNIINILLSLVLFVGIMALSFSSANITEEFITDISVLLMNSINRMYPPAALFVAATSKGNLLAFFAFFLLSVAPFALFALIVTKVFRTFRTYLTTTATRSKFDINQGYAKQTRTKSALHTLYLKEARRYFASPIYVVNTIVGVVMVFLLSVVLLFGGNAMLDELFKIPEVSQKIGAIVPLLIASIVGMTNPAAISLSMEGKAFPLLKSLPVSAMTVFSAKILFTLTLTVPTVLINAPLVIFALKLDLFKSIMTFLIPLLFCFLTALFGICVNLLFPNFKWTSEVSVVKQSMASMFGVLVPMTVGFAGAIGIGFIKTEIADIVLIAIAILFTLLSLLLHTFLRKRGESIYLKLI